MWAWAVAVALAGITCFGCTNGFDKGLEVGTLSLCNSLTTTFTTNVTGISFFCIPPIWAITFSFQFSTSPNTRGTRKPLLPIPRGKKERL